MRTQQGKQRTTHNTNPMLEDFNTFK